jgi:hypothetical protein
MPKRWTFQQTPRGLGVLASIARARFGLLEPETKRRNTERVYMITAITTYNLPTPMTREEAQSAFLSTASKYQGVAGLLRKYYYLSQGGRTIGGVYLWNSRAEAEAMFNDSWRAFMREKYRTDPLVAYFDCPVIVDNVSNEIISSR